MNLHSLRVAATLAVLAGLCSTNLQAAPACSLDALRALAPEGTQLTSAKRVNDDKLAFCQVEGTMALPGNRERFRLGLPEQWNGKFLFEATGGGAGVLVDVGLGARRGYATATTDTGHVGNPGEFDFWLDKSKRAGWIHDGVHIATVNAKTMVASYYRRAPAHNLLRGCSNGG
ncbi:MAG TPA: tannase/feruloyl esterase family alpha/beta hydrolase, partial [Solimonas sp.]|nr:tannase/feruloyl esterase family alpha/beta hydrolase [Solimonas sp.]